MIQIFNKTVRTTLLFVATFIGSTLNLYAQNTGAREKKFVNNPDASPRMTISGVILDASTGKAILGVSVVSGQFSATITDEKGNFTISVLPKNAVLTISVQGYQHKEIALKNERKIVIQLHE